MRVVIADDAMLLREGTARLLEGAGLDVVGAGDDAQKLLRMVDSEHPDVAIVDIRMPPTFTDEGLVAAEAIRAAHPDVGVLVLSQYLESSYAMRLLRENPERSGYLLKERVSDVAVLVDALKRIAEGECVLDPTIVAMLVRRPRDPDPLAELTDREREVLGLIAEGRPFTEALREACIGRVRPKIMTASTAILGLLPLLVLRLHGTEIERPLAIVMVGGLVTSTIFTLLALPTFYQLIHNVGVRWRSRRGATP